MSQRITREFHWSTGFDPTQAKTGAVPNSIYDGSNVWIWGEGLIESAKGFVSAGSSGGPNPLMNVGNSHGGCTGGGTVVDAFGTTFVTGSGTAYKAGSSIGSASSTLQELVSGTLVNVGIAQPSAPTIADSTVAGKNDGSYTICITLIRSATGEESIRSLPSNIISVSSKKIRISSVPTSVSQGINKIGIYCSYRNFGATGPWFHLSDVSIGASTFDVEWYNGELGVEAPTDYFPPPTGTHCFAVNNVMVQAGCYGGSGLGPSVPGKPGAYPPSFTVFLPGGGSITSCKATGFAGTVLVATGSSLNAVVATNSSITPITVRQIWPTTGFQTGSAWCTVEDEVYGFSGTRGAVRTQGDAAPDTSFANPVHKYFSDNGFTGSNTVVGYDPKTDTVMFCKGAICLPFARSRGWWHTPQTTTGSATTGVTLGGLFLLDTGSGALYSAEGGSGTSGFATFAFDDAQVPEFNKTIARVRAATNATTQLDVLTDLDLSTSASGAIVLTSGHGVWTHLNIRNVKTFSLKWSFTSLSQASLFEAVVQVIPHLVTR